MELDEYACAAIKASEGDKTSAAACLSETRHSTTVTADNIDTGQFSSNDLSLSFYVKNHYSYCISSGI